MNDVPRKIPLLYRLDVHADIVNLLRARIVSHHGSEWTGHLPDVRRKRLGVALDLALSTIDYFESVGIRIGLGDFFCFRQMIRCGPHVIILQSPLGPLALDEPYNHVVSKNVCEQEDRAQQKRMRGRPRTSRNLRRIEDQNCRGRWEMIIRNNGPRTNKHGRFFGNDARNNRFRNKKY